MPNLYAQEIDATFKNEILAQVLEMERDVTGLPMIEKVATSMFAAH
jgi:hypothetical protein